MAILNFNAATVTPDTGFGEPLPAGWYNVMMTGSEMKPTKDGTGAYLACEYTVMDGQYANRKVFSNLNIRNNNPTAQEIAYKQLSAICHAVGVIQCQDSGELHGKPLKIKVKVRIDKTGEYEPSNDITAYKNIDEQVQGGAPAGNPAMQQAPAGFAGMPQQNPMAQPQQPWQQQQMPPQNMQQPVQQPMQQQQFQQPQYQQQPQQPAQYQQQPMQPQGQQAAPAGAGQQPWEQAGNAQPWAQPQPQQMQQVQQAPQQQQMQQQPVQQAQQNPVVQQFAGAVPPWQQQPQ
jgi:hypothetical protein